MLTIFNINHKKVEKSWDQSRESFTTNEHLIKSFVIVASNTLDKEVFDYQIYD